MIDVAAALAARDARADFARCRKWLEDAIAAGDGSFTIDDVIAGIEAGRYHFWPGRRSAAVTEFAQYPRAKYLHVMLAGGDLAEILDELEPLFASFAKFHGCSKLVEAGRPGWERVLKTRGWKRAVVMLSKELS